MSGDVPKCPRCGEAHPVIACPYVKAVEFDPGTGLIIRRLEFLTPADYGRAPAVTREPDAPADDYPRLGQKNL